MSQYKPGVRLRSAVCTTEVVVIAAPLADITLSCGGAPLLAEGDAAAAGVALDAAAARPVLNRNLFKDPVIIESIELLRKGRFDEIFFVDLPDDREREAIWKIHLGLRKQDVKTINLIHVVSASDGFSGSEIEQAVVAALYRALHQKAPLTTDLLIEELTNTVPLSVTRREDIDQLRDAPHHPRTLRAAKLDLIHMRSVEIKTCEVSTGSLRQLIQRTHASLVMAGITFPNRQRRAPIAFARKRPVDVIFEPVAEASSLDVVGHPVDGVVQSDQFFAIGARADIPRITRVIQKRSMAAPAEWIGMHKSACAK